MYSIQDLASNSLPSPPPLLLSYLRVSRALMAAMSNRDPPSQAKSWLNRAVSDQKP